MRELAIDDVDHRLVKAASDLIEARFVVQRHHVASVLVASSGRTYVGVHIGSRRLNICAEMVALGEALSQGEEEIVAGVAVIKMQSADRPTVTSPCGLCREVLNFYAPRMTVLAMQDDRVFKTTVRDLLPAPWLLPGERSGAQGQRDEGGVERHG